MPLSNEELLQIEQYLYDKGIHLNVRQTSLNNVDRIYLMNSEGKGRYIEYEDMLNSIGDIKGKPGVGISSIEVTKDKNNNTNLIVIKMSNSTSKEFTIENGAKGDKGDKGDTGETGAKGDKGDNGDTGVGIENIVEYYLASSKPDGVTLSDEGWTTTVQVTSDTLKYLWNYEMIIYTDSTWYKSDPRIIGTYGDKGDQGEKGESYTTVIESSNGNIFRLSNVDTILTCRVYKNNVEITQDIPEYNFNWVRVSSDTYSDPKWNASSKAVGKRSVEITSDDCIGRTVFNCEVEIGD